MANTRRGLVWAEIKNHRGWYLLAFLLSGLPTIIATIWPTLTDKKVPVWLAEHGWPRLGILVIGWVAVAAIIAVVIVVRSYQTARQKQAERPTVQTVRVFYSSTQTVEISSTPGAYNETLNLDNAATMIQADEWSLEQVGMLLIESPPLTIDEPPAGEKYKAGESGFTVAFNPKKVPGFHIQQATISMSGTKYLFNRFNSPVHTVQVGERRFRVTLQSIRDKSAEKQKLIAYTFGISEE